MKILVLDINYPSNTNLYGDVFVHARVQQYIARGHDVHVLAFFTRGASYFFEGVAVTCVSTLREIREAITSIAPDVIAIHFFQGWMLRKLVLTSSVPVVIWVHGMEALGWFRRLFDIQSFRGLSKHLCMNTLQILRMRKLYSYAETHSGRMALVFVSQWMRDTAARDALRNIRPYHIIPNPIDTKLFHYERKDPSMRSHVLLIRSFDSRKYANDVAVKAIVALKSRPEFGKFRFTIVGRGRLFAKITAPLRNLSNVTLQNEFITRTAMKRLHSQHGVFLCPTRQDAQGVSMCEAMASGLVPITSNNTAIPEFVSDGVSGFLCDNHEMIMNALLKLWASPEQFQRMSALASASICEKSGSSVVVPRELDLMKALTPT